MVTRNTLNKVVNSYSCLIINYRDENHVFYNTITMKYRTYD